MRNARKWAVIVAGVMALSLVAAACSNDDGGDSGSSGSTGASGATGLSGSVTVSGSSTVQPISSLVAELFHDQNPTSRSASTAPAPATASRCSARARPTSATPPGRSRTTRRRRAQAAGIDYVELAIGFDGITVMTNPPNRRRHLPQLRRPLRAVRARVRGLRRPGRTPTRWPRRSAAPDDFPTCRSTSPHRARSPAPTTRSSSWRGSTTSRSSKALPRTNGHAPTRLPVLAERQRDHPGDRGFRRRARLGRLRLRAKGRPTRSRSSRSTAASGCVAPTHDTIADGSYPLSRSLYIYVNTAKSREPGAEGVRRLLPVRRRHRERRQAGRYVDLPADRLDATRATWDRLPHRRPGRTSCLERAAPPSDPATPRGSKAEMAVVASAGSPSGPPREPAPSPERTARPRAVLRRRGVLRR